MGREITAQPYCCHSPQNTAEKKEFGLHFFHSTKEFPLLRLMTSLLCFQKTFFFFFVTQAQPENDNAPKLHVRSDFLPAAKPTGHRTVRVVVVVGGGLLGGHDLKIQGKLFLVKVTFIFFFHTVLPP